MEKEGSRKILLILGLIILAVIVVGFFIFSAKQKTSEPDPVSEQCRFACDTNQKISFCDVERKLTDGSIATCDSLAKQNKFNVEFCSSISCVEETSNTACVSGLGSVWKTPASGVCPAEENKFVRERAASDSPPIVGQICCYYYE